MTQQLNLITPGQILWEEFMEPLGVSQNKLARDLDITPARIHDIVHGKRGISADTALRFAKYFNTTPEFWLNLQMSYDLRKSRRDCWPQIESRIRPYTQSSKNPRGRRGLKNPLVA